MSYLVNLLGDAYHEGMTEEEISTALETIATGEATELSRLKAALSKANSEAAGYKKQLRAKQSEEEAQAAIRQEEFERISQENAELKRSMLLSEKTTKLLAMGYDAKLAESTAVAMVDGDMDTVMSNQAKYLEAQKKTMSADLMRGTSRPKVGSEEGGSTNYAKEIEAAQLRGDYSAAAYYTRLQESEAPVE